MTTGLGISRMRWPLFALGALYVLGSAARFVTAQLVLNPLVSSDELVYRNMAYSFFRSGSFYETADLGMPAALPNVLYSWIISASFHFGDHFFGVARLINSLVIHLSLFAVYAMAREFMDQRRALAAAAVTALLPAFNTPMFLMTESLVYPVFLFAFYFTYKAMTSPGPGWRIASGACIAVSMLVKPGFVLMIFSTAIVYAVALASSLSKRDGARARSLLASFATVTVTAIAAFVAASYALKGGVSYGLSTYHAFTDGRNPGDAFPWSGIAWCAFAHVASLLFTWFLPACVCARVVARRGGDPRLRLFLAFAFTTLFIYMCGVLKLTTVMAWQEHFLRLHARYYTMIFPLLLVGFLAGCERTPWGLATRVAAVAFGAAVAAANVAFVFPRYAASGLLVVDYPDLAWHLRWPALVAAVSLTTLLVILWHAARTRMTPGPALALVAAVSVMANVGEIQQAIEFDRINSAQVDPLKRMVRARIPDNAARVAVVDSIHLCRFTLAFWYPYHYTTSLDHPHGALVEKARIPDDTEFVVACDDYRFDFPVTEVAREGSKAVYAVTRE
ncbi:MAG: glycosyltransferase family 39 protein [bacterium]